MYKWPFSCKSLQRKGVTFEESQTLLDLLQHKLRNALAQKNAATAVDACMSVLEWGGVRHGNAKWVTENAGRMVEILNHDRHLLTHSAPTHDLLEGLYRFNAGFVKIYSLLLDSFIIYDGRVGAAMGCLVCRWCQSRSQMAVPELLKFPWGAPNEGAGVKQPKQRNPSSHNLSFPELKNQHASHALWTIRAGWLLQATIFEHQSRFVQLPNPLRAIEAALFMIGYDLGPSTGNHAPASPYPRAPDPLSTAVSASAQGRPRSNMSSLFTETISPQRPGQ
jgi:hypothetical protein